MQFLLPKILCLGIQYTADPPINTPEYNLFICARILRVNAISEQSELELIAYEHFSSDGKPVLNELLFFSCSRPLSVPSMTDCCTGFAVLLHQALVLVRFVRPI